MNNEKIAKYVQNIFHLENMTADDDSYNRGSISSNSWGDGITIRWVIRDFGDEKEVNLRYAYSMGTYTIAISSEMTSKEASKEIVELIARVLITQADTVDPNTGMNNILSWPYNCNLAYVEYLIEALQYGDNEIKSSMQGQERGILAIMDEYGCSREEAIDIMNSEVTSGCHGKAKKKNKKEIKSSLVDEFEEKYSEASNEWSDEECNTCRDSFLNDFAKDHGITYDETKKMLDELEDKWYKDADNASIVDIYSSTRRNITNVNRIFG